jgi:hypothetical protein
VVTGLGKQMLGILRLNFDITPQSHNWLDNFWNIPDSQHLMQAAFDGTIARLPDSRPRCGAPATVLYQLGQQLWRQHGRRGFGLRRWAEAHFAGTVQMFLISNVSSVLAG